MSEELNFLKSLSLVISRLKSKLDILNIFEQSLLKHKDKIVSVNIDEDVYSLIITIVLKSKEKELLNEIKINIIDKLIESEYLRDIKVINKPDSITLVFAFKLY